MEVQINILLYTLLGLLCVAVFFSLLFLLRKKYRDHRDQKLMSRRMGPEAYPVVEMYLSKDKDKCIITTDMIYVP